MPDNTQYLGYGAAAFVALGVIGVFVASRFETQTPAPQPAPEPTPAPAGPPAIGARRKSRRRKSKRSHSKRR